MVRLFNESILRWSYWRLTSSQKLFEAVLSKQPGPYALHSEALQLGGGYVTWNLNIQQIQLGARVPARYGHFGERGRSKGQGIEWGLECVKGKTSNFVVAEHKALQEAMSSWIIHDAVLILTLRKLLSHCAKS